MLILNVNKVCKSFGFGKLLDNLSFTVNEGERIAIVGKNGCGKSTLLKLINKTERLDSGEITIKKDVVVEYLEQGDVADSKTGKCIDIIKSAFASLYEIEDRLRDYESKMQIETNENALNKLISSYSNLQEKFIQLGGYEIDTKVNMVLEGLKIDKSLMDREFSSLSGGERTIINLAKILLSNPDLLLLDEPTNHLDITRLEFLENYLKNYKGSVVIVSHDRYFLDRVVNKVLELEDGKIKIYFGNYSSYLRQKEDEEVKEFEIYKIQQKRIQEMEKAIKRLKEWGKMADNPMFFRRAKAIQSNLDRYKENALDKPQTTKKLPIKFNASNRGSQFVITIKDLNLTIGNKNLLHNANCVIENGEKVAIIGENGCGKSTLIKAILNGNDSIKLGGNQRIGYLSQIIEFEDKKQNVLNYFMSSTGLNEEQTRSKLFNMQFFKSDVIKSVGSLSGGEKIRLKLAVMLQQDINFLILDEPTNHIDIDTREVLEDTLKDFKGTILFVSHDRYFINKLSNKIVEFYNQKLYTFYGNYDDYLLDRENIHLKY